MVDLEQRRRLGQFLRAHREQLAPSDPAGRRRTPGLRREELAERAGISTIWCAWIEQGREVQASPKALSRLARALGLTPDERATMFELAGRCDPDRDAKQPAPAVPASLTTVVASNTNPAYALDRLWNACCWNEAAARLFPGWLGPDRERNLLRYAYLDRSARTLTPRWQDWAQRLVEEFRADGRAAETGGARAFIELLRAGSAVFAKAWDAPRPLGRDSGLRRFSQPGGGLQTYQVSSFHSSDYSNYKLIILTPLAPD